MLAVLDMADTARVAAALLVVEAEDVPLMVTEAEAFSQPEVTVSGSLQTSAADLLTSSPPHPLVCSREGNTGSIGWLRG